MAVKRIRETNFYTVKKRELYYSVHPISGKSIFVDDVNLCYFISNKQSAKQLASREGGTVVKLKLTPSAYKTTCPWVTFRSTKNGAYIGESEDGLWWTKWIDRAWLCAHEQTIKKTEKDMKVDVQYVHLIDQGELVK